MSILVFLLKFIIVLLICGTSDYLVSKFFDIDFWEVEDKEEWKFYHVGRFIGLTEVALVLILLGV